MGYRLCVSIAALFATVGPAAGQPSEDLRLCAGLHSAPERIACFRAVGRTRAPARKIVATSNSAPVPAAASAPTQPIAASASGFGGAYGALGATYGLSRTRSFIAGNTVTGPGASVTGDGEPRGPSAVLVGGYNIQAGSLLVGLEGSGRFGWERYAASGATYSAYALGTATTTYSYVSDVGVHGSLRAGWVQGDTLIFGKAGFGAAHFNERYDLNTTYWGPFAGAAKVTAGRWVSSVLLGVGMEQNLGRWFLRIGIDAEGAFVPGTSFTAPFNIGELFYGSANGPAVMWTMRASALAGLRF